MGSNFEFKLLNFNCNIYKQPTFPDSRLPSLPCLKEMENSKKESSSSAIAPHLNIKQDLLDNVRAKKNSRKRVRKRMTRLNREEKLSASRTPEKSESHRKGKLDEMTKALSMVLDGASLRTAAKKHGVSKSTLGNYVKILWGKSTKGIRNFSEEEKENAKEAVSNFEFKKKGNPNFSKTLSKQEEEALVAYIRAIAEISAFPIDMDAAADLAGQIAAARGNPGAKFGRSWKKRMLDEYGLVSLKSRRIDYKRVEKATEEVRTKVFDKFEALIRRVFEKEILDNPSELKTRFWNVDETNNGGVQGKRKKRVFVRNAKYFQRNDIYDGDKVRTFVRSLYLSIYLSIYLLCTNIRSGTKWIQIWNEMDPNTNLYYSILYRYSGIDFILRTAAGPVPRNSHCHVACKWRTCAIFRDPLEAWEEEFVGEQEYPCCTSGETPKKLGSSDHPQWFDAHLYF